ncbi:MAG TPA: PIN domain nuclease, partial [Planctomycetota bacterium]|nr:PIN domain nuclease [Planctomycetota bacterium]
GGPPDPPGVRKLGAFLRGDGEVVLTGLILQEVLQGFREERAFRAVSLDLESIPLLRSSRADFVAAAALHRRCAASGVSASTADCQIASAAIRHRCRLLTADRDFERIARLSPLRLA